MKVTVTVIVTAPDGTGGIPAAVAYALDNPMNYPDGIDTSDWGVSVYDSQPGPVDPDYPHSRYADDPPVPLAERDPALAEAILEPDDEEHTPEELAYQRAQIAAGFGDPYAQD